MYLQLALFLNITHRYDPDEYMKIIAGNEYYDIKIHRFVKNGALITDSDTGKYIYEPADISIVIKPKGTKVLPLIVNLAYPKHHISECYAYQLPDSLIRNEETESVMKYIKIASATLDNLKLVIDRYLYQ